MTNYYAFSSMTKKANKFKALLVDPTSDADYMGWEAYFSGEEHLRNNDINYWTKLDQRYAEDVQLTILKSIAVVGLKVESWNRVFRLVSLELLFFTRFASKIVSGDYNANNLFLVVSCRLTDSYQCTYGYPCVDPAWLYQYDYSQDQYLMDLTEYWDNIHPEYSKPWGNTRIGQDSPEVARIKRIAREGRHEIDETARHYRDRIGISY